MGSQLVFKEVDFNTYWKILFVCMGHFIIDHTDDLNIFFHVRLRERRMVGGEAVRRYLKE